LLPRSGNILIRRYGDLEGFPVRFVGFFSRKSGQRNGSASWT